jgi:phosphoserine phosphatase
MTRAAMEGSVGVDEVFAKRLDLIRPDRALCEHVANLYLEHVVPGAKQLAADLRVAGWTPVILSGGFKPIIEPLARELGIEHVEAVPLHFDADGSYAGYDATHPASHTMGKCCIIREWQAATMPTATVMMGDGASDLETRDCVDLFICYTGVVDRPAVSSAADMVVHDMAELHDRMTYLHDIISNKINLAYAFAEMNDAGDMSSKATKKKASKAAKPAAKKAAKTATKETKPASPEAKPAAKNNAVKGKRYTTAEKKEILQFIADYDSKKGRGGQTQAAKQYGVTVLTLANWRKAAAKAPAPAAAAPSAPAAPAAPAPAPAAKKAGKRGRKPGSKNAKPAAAKPAAAKPAVAGSLTAKLARLLELDKSIVAAEGQLAKLTTEFAAIKASL